MKILIVGGGVAGICLGHQLEKKGIDFKIITKKENYSSKIAAGMINPIVFRKMLKSWEADTLIPYLTDFYKELEQKIATEFFIEMPIRRLFSSAEEKEMWKERLTDESYAQYLSIPDEDPPAYAINPFGHGFVLKGGYISSVKFVESNQAYFIENGKLEYAEFDYSALKTETNSYKEEQYDFIIFAQGYQGTSNPYFGYLPLNHTKGEILEIESSEILENEILNKKCFVLPMGNQQFRLGATFAWDTDDVSPTEEKKEELLEKYSIISNAKIKINEHKAGIRPTVPDRRVLIGKHPEHEQLVCFNGLGTKGYMLAPYLSEQLLNHLLNGEEIHPEINIQRWYKKHIHKYTAQK